MHAQAPKQAVINSLTDSNPQAKREERGILAKPESIIFIKEKSLPYTYAYVVRYTSTTGQQWYDTSYVVQKVDGTFIVRSGVYCKNEERFLTSKENQGMDQHKPLLRISSGGGKPVIQKEASLEKKREDITRDGSAMHTLRIGSSSINDELLEDRPNYRFLVGYLTANGQEVASVRMLPQAGIIEEDEVQDNTVLFLTEYSPPITFEFYDSSHTLLATQQWSA
jgi:hypothetical protein